MPPGDTEPLVNQMLIMHVLNYLRYVYIALLGVVSSPFLISALLSVVSCWVEIGGAIPGLFLNGGARCVGMPN